MTDSIWRAKPQAASRSQAVLFQYEIGVPVQDVVRPIDPGPRRLAHRGAAGQQGSADALAGEESFVELAGEGLRRLVAHRPVGADEVGDAAAEERLGEADALGQPLR